jgi:hypothetical protein
VAEVAEPAAVLVLVDWSLMAGSGEVVRGETWEKEGGGGRWEVGGGRWEVGARGGGRWGKGMEQKMRKVNSCGEQFRGIYMCVCRVMSCDVCDVCGVCDVM